MKAVKVASEPRTRGTREPTAFDSRPASGLITSIATVEGTRKSPARVTLAPKP